MQYTNIKQANGPYYTEKSTVKAESYKKKGSVREYEDGLFGTF